MRRLLVLAALLAGPAFAQGSQSYSPTLFAAAQAGDPAAQFALGEAYRYGNGIKADREQALSWFRKAAPRDTRAADELGVLLFVKGERRQAIPLLQAATQRGNAQALYILGTARFNGDYVPKDVGAGYAEMRLAAQKGLPEAQRSLTLMESYLTPDDRVRADALAVQPAGPETGALPVPPPPVARAAVSPPMRTVKTPYAAAVPSAAPSLPPSTPGPTGAPPTVWPAVTISAAEGAAPLASIELPPSRAPASAQPAVQAPKPAPPAAPLAAPASGGWQVQLAAVASSAAAEAEWKRLAARVPALAALSHAAVPAGAVTRLRATGLASRAEASALCQKLVAAGFGCFVVPPAA